ncbi:MAG: hypothetical protein JL50_02850 [Peptococcaceae bacterium BICA1-7]|nr:MAG: hypothetical protein JL50_02850 [Peptococcaceae bacterium BICA1-7]HBV97797.1 hypothetical protein [Desulfotomaculum sp.]
MCEIYDFPKADDLFVMEKALECFLLSRNPAARNVMVGVLKVMLDKYNVSKLSLRQCIVCRGNQGGVRLLPRQTTQTGTCPDCGAHIYTPEIEGGRVSILSILEGEYGDVVTYGCSCGRVFGKWEEIS